MYFDKPGWFWTWLVFSAIMWGPIAYRWHATGFTRAWLILSLIWWSPIALGELLRLSMPPGLPGAIDYQLVTRFLLYVWVAVGLLISVLGFRQWWSFRYP